MAQAHPSATIVVPAHNEEAGLRRLLPALVEGATPGEFRILVMCNGCTDGSADEARRHGPDVTVVELPEPSKAGALDAANKQVAEFPVIYVDADVVLDWHSVRALIARLADGSVLATAPRRRLDEEGVSLPARWYYDVWERLPQVRIGLFGRGVIALSQEGYERVAALPRFMSDDLAYSESFTPGERTITEGASVTVWPARTWRALLDRRIRVIRGNKELRGAGRVSEDASTGLNDLVMIIRREPALTLKVPFFALTTIIARLRERLTRSGQAVWQRDETSRAV